MSFERPENIRSTMDLRHLDRMSRPPEPPAPELPLIPEIDPADLIEGPRCPLRYGSAATTIRVSTSQWRMTDYHDGPHSRSARWRPLSTMEIELKHQHGRHLPKSRHVVASVVPHGGHTDDHLQFVLADGTHIPFSHARWAEDDER